MIVLVVMFMVAFITVCILVSLVYYYCSKTKTTENERDRAKKFRKRFFLWSIIILLFTIGFQEFWIININMYDSPLVTTLEQEDIRVFEDWLGITFPEGSIPRKLQGGLGFHDSKINIQVDIPTGTLELFRKQLNDKYYRYDYPSLDNPDGKIAYSYHNYNPYSKLDICLPENGYIPVYISEDPETQIYDLLHKYIVQGKCSFGSNWIFDDLILE